MPAASAAAVWATCTHGERGSPVAARGWPRDGVAVMRSSSTTFEADGPAWPRGVVAAEVLFAISPPCVRAPPASTIGFLPAGRLGLVQGTVVDRTKGRLPYPL